MAPGLSWVGGADQGSKAGAPPEGPGIGYALPSRKRKEPFSSQPGDHAAVGEKEVGYVCFPSKVLWTRLHFGAEEAYLPRRFSFFCFILRAVVLKKILAY